MLQALDEEFPERPLFPSDLSVAAEGERLCALSDQLSKSGYKWPPQSLPPPVHSHATHLLLLLLMCLRLCSLRH